MKLKEGRFRFPPFLSFHFMETCIEKQLTLGLSTFRLSTFDFRLPVIPFEG